MSYEDDDNGPYAYNFDGQPSANTLPEEERRAPLEQQYL